MKKKKWVKIVYFKNLFFPGACILFILCLVLFPKLSLTAAAKGLNLWMTAVFPSLFPFFVGADLLNRSGIIRALGVLFEPIMRPLFRVPGCGSFALLMGITSGYPIGAKLTTSMREERLLTKVEAERLLAFSNNSGPLFIVGAVAVGMFNIPELGLFFLTCHILACISVGILFRFYGKDDKKTHTGGGKGIITRFKRELILMKPTSDFGTIFGNAIKDSIATVLTIGGFITFFSVVISLLLELGVINMISQLLTMIFMPFGVDKGIMTALTSGFFEITTGTNMVIKAAHASFAQKLAAASAIIGWAGLSVHFQVLGIIRKTDISIKPYLAGKFIQGVIAAIYTYFALKILGLSFKVEAPAFIPWDVSREISWHSKLAFLGDSLTFPLGFLLLCTAAAFLLTKIRALNPKGYR